MFNVTRIYTDTNGDSHFDDIEIQLIDRGMVGELSDPVPVESLIFREVAPAYDWDFHPAPQRQYIVLLDGEIEIETSLGERRSFRQGEILLMEDTTGKGHKTRNVLPAKRKSLFITLA
jgi:hypothetical protein